MGRRDLDEEDPEFGERPQPEPPPCRCGGSGWVTVGPGYAERLHPMPDPPALGATEGDFAAYEARCEWVQALRTSAADSVYPCKEHNEARFHRWAQRHYAPDHDPRACAACGGETEGRR